MKHLFQDIQPMDPHLGMTTAGFPKSYLPSHPGNQHHSRNQWPEPGSAIEPDFDTEALLGHDNFDQERMNARKQLHGNTPRNIDEIGSPETLTSRDIIASSPGATSDLPAVVPKRRRTESVAVTQPPQHRQSHKNEQSQPPPSPRSMTIEQRVENALLAVNEAGFESLDELMTTYYTERFQPQTLACYAQSASRSHRLRGFLEALHESSHEWVGREAHGYYDAGMALTERLFEEEMASLSRGCDDDGNDILGEPSVAHERKRTFLADTVRQLLRDETTSELCKRDWQVLQHRVSRAALFGNRQRIPLAFIFP